MGERCLSLAMFLVAMVAVADTLMVYRWIDANGVVHFSDQPPGDQSAEQVNADPKRLNSVPPPRPVTRSDSTPQGRPPARKKKRVRHDDKMDREKRCQTTQLRIENIHARMRAGYNAKQGERMREQLRRYEKDRVRWCMGRGN